jgi:hypothetical protein
MSDSSPSWHRAVSGARVPCDSDFRVAESCEQAGERRSAPYDGRADSECEVAWQAEATMHGRAAVDLTDTTARRDA